MNERFLNIDELVAGLDHIRLAPKDSGMLELIVARPITDQRTILTHCELTLDAGVPGDQWAKGCWKSLPDGRPHPDVQLTLINVRAIALLAQSKDRWPLAGDNFYVDLDLSAENLPPGQKLAIGTAILIITEVPHTGCKKFAQRFGPAAVPFVSSDEGKRLSLRGIYARVYKNGVATVGDVIRKVA